MPRTGHLYADLAGYYDQFCAEVEYEEQCAFASRAFDCFARSDGRDYLDLACGTGQHLLHMAERGFVPSGLDNSAAMLARAAARTPQAELLLCDMADLDRHAAYDLITCFLYSIHYSHPTTRLAETLRRAWHALKPGGVLLFNAVDVRGIADSRQVVSRLRDGDSELCFRSGWTYRGEGDALDLQLAISRTIAGVEEHWRDHHTMTAITLPALQRMLEDTGFETTLLAHDYRTLQAWDGTAFNAMVVACKNGG